MFCELLEVLMSKLKLMEYLFVLKVCCYKRCPLSKVILDQITEQLNERHNTEVNMMLPLMVSVNSMYIACPQFPHVKIEDNNMILENCSDN